VSANADRWRKLWCEIQGRVREMALLGCRPSVALTGLAMLAHSRENPASRNNSRVSKIPSEKSRQQAGNNQAGATGSTPGKAGPERGNPQETGLAIAARRLLAARRNATEVDRRLD